MSSVKPERLNLARERSVCLWVGQGNKQTFLKHGPNVAFRPMPALRVTKAEIGADGLMVCAHNRLPRPRVAHPQSPRLPLAPPLNTIPVPSMAKRSLLLAAG